MVYLLSTRMTFVSELTRLDDWTEALPKLKTEMVDDSKEELLRISTDELNRS
jgi:hypothetical protein